MARLNPAPATSGLPAPLVALLFGTAGAVGTFLLLELWSAMAFAEQPLLWWAGRALGFLAYVALWLSMVFGVLVSSKGFGGRISQKWVMDLHQEWTLAAVIATVLHVVVLVTHAESGVTPWASIIPFASERLTGEIAMGTVAGLVLALIAATSWMRARVPYAAWRAIHALAFGAMILAIVHSITAGTDSETAGAQFLYLGTSMVLSAVTALRVVLAVAGGKPAAPPERAR
ncbi:MAG: ferric reductase-like transmembrane domain-containing protein [Dehalococcoidia bacterium]